MIPDEVYEKVDQAISDLIVRLPAPIRARAEEIPCVMEDKDPDGHRVLGRYMNDMGPAIILYVGQVYDKEEKGDLDKTISSLKQVYLHELGHHLGLGEWELDIRGL